MLLDRIQLLDEFVWTVQGLSSSFESKTFETSAEVTVNACEGVGVELFFLGTLPSCRRKGALQTRRDFLQVALENWNRFGAKAHRCYFQTFCTIHDDIDWLSYSFC